MQLEINFNDLQNDKSELNVSSCLVLHIFKYTEHTTALLNNLLLINLGALIITLNNAETGEL